MRRLATLSTALALLLITAIANAAEVQLYFSPKGGCQKAITDAIGNAQAEVLVAAYSFTSKPIADALLQAARRGVKVRVIVDRRQPNARSGQTPRLHAAGVDTRVDKTHPLMHQKTIIIDRQLLITGSYNFSANAEQRNSELLVFILDPKTASQAAAHWHLLYAVSVNPTFTNTKPQTNQQPPPCLQCSPRPRLRRRP